MHLEIDEGFFAHPKTLRFCALMQNAEAWSHIQRLWAWACRSAPNGDLSLLEPAEVELAMGWRAMDGKAYAAAVKAGFIDESEPGRPLAIHGWMDRTGGAIKRMADKAAYLREHRTKSNRYRTGTEPAQNQNEVVTEHQEPPSEPTSPVQSSPDKTRQVKKRERKEEAALARDPTQENLFARLCRAFNEAWESVYGEPYQFSPKDNAQLGLLISRLRGSPQVIESLPEMFRAYVRDPDKFAAETHRHSLAWFCSDNWVNKALTRARTQGLSQREIRGAVAAYEWAEGERR